MHMDKELFWELLEPVHASAAAFCRKLTGDRDEGDDLYQEGLLVAWRRFGTLREQPAFRTWLYRILVNRYKNRCRSAWWRRHRPLTRERAEITPGSDPRVDHEARRQLRRLLKLLTPRDRALVILHEIDGWTVAELARTLKMPEGTVKTRLYRARRRMRQQAERSSLRINRRVTVNEAAYALQRSKPTDD